MLTQTKDKIEDKRGIQVLVKQGNTAEKSRIFCDKIVYMHEKIEDDYFEHHLMIYNKGYLIYKVWLPNGSQNKEFENINEALKGVNMEVVELMDKNVK